MIWITNSDTEEEEDKKTTKEISRIVLDVMREQ